MPDLSQFLTIAHLFGLLTLVAGVIAFQMKSRRQIILGFAIATILMGTHFLLLQKIAAALLVYLASLRYIIAYFTEDKRLMYVFIVVAIITFLVSYKNWYDFLSLAAAITATIASFQSSSRDIRLINLSTSAFWLIHNIIIFTPFLIMLELSVLSSNVIGYYRHEKKNMINRYLYSDFDD